MVQVRFKKSFNPLYFLFSSFFLTNIQLRPRIFRDEFGAVYPSLGVFYNRIPKAANTMVVSLLSELDTGEVEDRRVIKRKIVRPSQLSWEDAKKFDSFFKFTFVRNPFERLLSAWMNKVVNGDSKYQIYPGFRDGSPQSFAKFVNALEAGALYSNRHWRPQVSILMFRPRQFDLIGRVEQFVHDFSLITDKIGRHFPNRELTRPYPTDKGKETRARDSLARYYSPKEVARVVDLYSRDFDDLGYSKDPFWL